MISKVINDTTHEFKVKAENAGIFVLLAPLRSGEEYINPNGTYKEYFKLSVAETSFIIERDTLEVAQEITLYETLEHTIRWRISKERGKFQQLQPSDNILDLADFDVLTKGASSRIETIETSCASLVKLLKQVKICPAQCNNLVHTCLEDTKQMIWAYFAVSKDDMWQLFYAEKLPHLVSSLDRLLSTLGSTEDLLQACGSQWGQMGLLYLFHCHLRKKRHSPSLISSSMSSNGILTQSIMYLTWQAIWDSSGIRTGVDMY